MTELPSTPMARMLQRLITARGLPLWEETAPPHQSIADFHDKYMAKGLTMTHAAYGATPDLEFNYARVAAQYRSGKGIERAFLWAPRNTVEIIDEGKITLLLQHAADLRLMAELRKRVEFVGYGAKTPRITIRNSMHGEYEHIERFLDAVWK